MSVERERAWKDILTESAFALSRDLLTGDALTAAIHAFERVNAKIPTALLPTIYERSMKLKDERGGSVFWDARAMWRAYQEHVEEVEGRDDFDPSRLLTDNAAAACKRCYGTGMERMPDGAVRPGCQHAPMTDAEDAEIERNRVADAEFVRKQTEFMREALKTVGSPKPPIKPVPVKPAGKTFRCDSCGRDVDAVFGWEAGEECGDLINRAHQDGEIQLCKGRMVEKV